MTNWEDIQLDPTLLSYNIINARRSLANQIKDSFSQSVARRKRALKIKKSLFSDMNKANEIINQQLVIIGPSQEDIQEYEIKNSGILKFILVDFPIGSHYAFTIDILLDNAVIISQLRGNANVKTLELTTKVDRNTILSFRMTSDSDISLNSTLKCFIDIIIEVQKNE